VAKLALLLPTRQLSCRLGVLRRQLMARKAVEEHQRHPVAAGGTNGVKKWERVTVEHTPKTLSWQSWNGRSRQSTGQGCPSPRSQ